jgi:hypothetical protein
VTTYATVEQLAAAPWGLAPPDAARLLVRASEVIDQALRTAIYDVDAITGAPTEAAVIQVLADATCAQVEFWETGDEEDDILGPVQGISLAGMQIQYGGSGVVSGGRVAPTYLAPRAHRILVNAGLRDMQPVSW